MTNPETDVKTQYKKTYPVEVEFAERDDEGNARKGSIEVPWLTSEQTFDVESSPEYARIQDLKKVEEPDLEKSSHAIIDFGKMVIRLLLPDIFKTLSPVGGYMLVNAVFSKEFKLGELPKNQ
jgi:hypothetical protein